MIERRFFEGRSIRWDPARAQTAYAEGFWVRKTLGDALKQAALTTPQRVAIVDGNERLRCDALYDQARSLASALLQRAAPGSVVSFMLPNWHEAAVIYLAAHLAGMVANPILPSLRDHDLSFVLSDLRSAFLFIPEKFRGHDYAAMLTRVQPRLPAPTQVVVVRGAAGAHLCYVDLLGEAGPCAWPEVEPDAARLVLYTSGTTGTPKGVMHSQNSIHALVRQLGQHWRVAAGDTFLVPSPISHIGGSIYAFECPLLLQTTAVLMERWEAGEALALMQRERCSHMAGATPFLQQLLAAARAAETPLHDLKVFICGGASVPPSLIREAAAHFDRTAFTRVYGSTEVPVTTVGVPDRGDLSHAAETDGRVGCAAVKLVDANGQVASEGEIRAAGPQMLIGYLHEQDESSVFDEEGYYRTGDLGRWVDDGYLVVSGRTKDIIIRKGENISPKEVEDCLIDHPNIVEVAIVGVPDEERGERACAVLVPRRRPGPDVGELRAFLKALGMASFKIPEQVVELDHLPKNDAGKVLKHKIRAQLQGGDPQV